MSETHALKTELAATGTLMDAIRAFSEAQSLHEIVAIVKRAARSAAAADGAAFVIREGDLCWYADEDAIAPLWKGKRFPMDACVSGWSMHHRLAVAIPDIRDDLRVPQDAYRETFVRSMVMVPIRSAAPVGAIGVYWAEPREIPAETVHWMQALADATSAAIEAVLARRESERMASRLAEVSGGRNGQPEIVRMCAWSRRILFQDQWISVEAYLRARFGVIVTHGLADDALESLIHEIEGEFRPDTRWERG